MPRRAITNPHLSKTIGERIRLARDARAWTQGQLAEAIGVRPETVCRYERGSATVSLAALLKIAGALDVHVETLLGRAAAHLSRAETALVERFRLLDGERQRAVKAMMRAAATPPAR